MIVGCGYVYECPECGYVMELNYGYGFHSNPDNPEIREDVLDGRYGPEAKHILERCPATVCSWYAPLLRCRCGNYSSEDAVILEDAGHRRKRHPVSFKCGLCRRRMSEIEELSDEPAECPKCRKAEMKYISGLCWD